MWRVAICFLAGSLLVSSQTQTFQIAGQVVRHATNRAARGVRVSVSLVGHPDHQATCITRDDGEFFFSGLPPGKYSLAANDHGWSQLFQQLDEYSTAIAVGPGLDSEHIVFPLDSPATITGSVLDDDGDPVRNATVYLFGRFLLRGAYRTGLKSTDSTGTDGTFHFTHLAPGTYYVAVSGRPWYAQNGHLPARVPQDVAVPAPPAELDVAYPLTYYANATTSDAATPLKLEEGARAELKFSLHAVPALHIALDGIEKQADQQIIGSVSQIGPGGTLVNVQAWIANSELTGIAPGDYVLSTNLIGPKQPLPIGSQRVTLTGDSTVHLSDAIKTSATGKVVLDGDIPRGLVVLLQNLGNGSQAIGWVDKDGSFAVNDVPPGRYELLLANTPELYMHAVKVKGATYSKGQLEVTQGARIELTITAAKGMSNVDGIALQGKKPIGGAMVLLLPQDLSHGNYIPRDQSDSDGTFTLRLAAPGRYTLVAIDNGRDLEYANPAVMAPYLQAGRVIDVPLPKNTSVQVDVQQRR